MKQLSTAEKSVFQDKFTHRITVNCISILFALPSTGVVYYIYTLSSRIWLVTERFTYLFCSAFFSLCLILMTFLKLDTPAKSYRFHHFTTHLTKLTRAP